jgi:hypothetical protein
MIVSSAHIEGAERIRRGDHDRCRARAGLGHSSSVQRRCGPLLALGRGFDICRQGRSECARLQQGSVGRESLC